MKRLALIGSKDFAEQIQTYVESKEMFSVVGYFDDFEERGTIIRNRPVLGNISDVEKCFKENLFDYIFFAAGYNNFAFRNSVFSSLKGRVPFANIIDASVTIEQNVQIGEGVYIGEYCYICKKTIIGDNVFIHGGCVISHDNIIGNHSYLSGRIDTAGFCEIGENNFIGVRVLFADHVKTCADVWIGIGCIVAKDIKSPGKYMSPAAKLYKIE